MWKICYVQFKIFRIWRLQLRNTFIVKWLMHIFLIIKESSRKMNPYLWARDDIITLPPSPPQYKIHKHQVANYCILEWIMKPWRNLMETSTCKGLFKEPVTRIDLTVTAKLWRCDCQLQERWATSERSRGKKWLEAGLPQEGVCM